ncbi:MAG: PA2169 family four-helix-bundle protein [Saprospiraceae bacterium]
MNNDKSIEVLNTLITINNDRIEGYDTASKETEEQELKSLFAKFIQTSKKCKQALETEVGKLGGKPAEGTRTTGKFFRVWMDVKAALTGKDRKGILESCEYGEAVALDTYQNVLKDNRFDLTEEHQNMIVTQHASLKADHDRVRSMHDALVEA